MRHLQKYISIKKRCSIRVCLFFNIYTTEKINMRKSGSSCFKPGKCIHRLYVLYDISVITCLAGQLTRQIYVIFLILNHHFTIKNKVVPQGLFYKYLPDVVMRLLKRFTQKGIRTPLGQFYDSRN